MNELALFAGAGGGILGGTLLGWRTVAAVEIEEYPRAILLQRQADGILPRFPIWDDVRTFDGKTWKGKVDVISGGFPCQDISAAGKGIGIPGERSGLWTEMARIVGEIRPRFVFVENSPVLTIRGLGTVLGDLATLGYNAEWGVLGADDVGLSHVRKRIWILAYSREMSWCDVYRRPIEAKSVMGERRLSPTSPSGVVEAFERAGDNTQQGSSDLPSYLCGVPDGVANLVDRLAAVGNGQVPAVAALAWQTLYNRITIKVTI